jgi:hypothetical protein
MLNSLKYFPVNWIDGMKISQSHFIQLENSISDRIRDNAAIGITDFNYGILPPEPGKKSSLNLVVNKDQSGLVTVKLLECHAITASGIRIELNNENASALKTLETTLKTGSESNFYITLIIDPFQQIPIGQPNSEEMPLRHPFALPFYRMELIPENQININQTPADFLIIGKLKNSNGEINLDKEFIPSCTKIQSYPALIDEFNSLGDLLGQMGQYSTAIVKKVKGEKQNTELANNIMYLAEKVVFFLADKIAAYRLTGSQLPPVYAIQIFLSFVYFTKSVFECQPERDREIMFTYFQQWTDLSPAQFQEHLANALETQYNHQDIAGSFSKAKNFAHIMLKLFKQLATLKYIGDTPNSGIVIGETVETKKPEQKRGWSFLND